MEGIDDSSATELNGRESLILSSNLVLDRVGWVFLSLTSVGMHWQVIESLSNQDELSCLGVKLVSKSEIDIEFSNIYAAELINWGSVHVSLLANAKEYLLGHSSGGMYRFSVHVVQRSNNQPSIWIPSVFTFGSEDLQTCQMWVNQINISLNREMGRPKNLLVFVHPKSGKGNGCKNWELVAPIFSRAKIQTKVTVTERAGQAYDMMSTITNKELNSYDGVVAVGGDGFFNEILNGLLASRLKVPFPPTPTDIHPAAEKGNSLMVNQSREHTVEHSDHAEDSSPLLLGQCLTELSTITGNEDGRGCNSAEGSQFVLPNEWFRLGLIPAGSTDAIVICTTGARDPMTSALHIVLGKRVQLDIAQVVRWKLMSTSKINPFVRYAASFCGYGFYGDVITESEKYRWMGPKRYDYAGTLVFLNHRSYEAEIRYLESTTDNKTSSDSVSGNRKRTIWGKWKPTEKAICRVNCQVCDTKPSCTLEIPTTGSMDETRWVKTRGRYLSIGGAIISCRNERAPDGLVADAHLSDGFLHLIMIKDCPHALYLWHLTQLARNGGNPLDFEFVEHHKTKAFTFTSFGRESVWNLDGEMLQAHQLSAQVLRGLVSLFATGPNT